MLIYIFGISVIAGWVPRADKRRFQLDGLTPNVGQRIPDRDRIPYPRRVVPDRDREPHQPNLIAAYRGLGVNLDPTWCPALGLAIKAPPRLMELYLGRSSHQGW